MYKFLYILLFCLFSINLNAQGDTEDLRSRLNDFSKEKPGLNDVLKVDVSGLPLHDFIAAIASEHQLNISVDYDLNQSVNNNFYDVTVKDVLLFLAEKYRLDISFMSNIMIIKKHIEDIKPVAQPQKIIDVAYNKENDFLSIKLNNDTLSSVAKAIIDKSGKNIVLSPDVKNLPVSAYILNRPFEQVIEMMAKSNGFIVNRDENGFYYIEKNLQPDITTDRNAPKNRIKRPTDVNAEGYFEVTLSKNGLLRVDATAADASELISEAAEKLNVTYFLYNDPENEKVTLLADNITFDELLEHIFRGRKYTFKKKDDFYMIGEQVTQGLRVTEVIQLENRSIESVMMSLPKAFSERVEIKEFVELNGLIVSGAKETIEEMKVYIKQIDRVVPLVQIDVMIVQYNKSHTVETGIKAGLDNTPGRKTSGVLFPTGDISMNSTSVNSLIDAFNGMGVMKIGKVTDAFYLNLQFLEDNSIIKIESTPKIATISGHEAKLAIGETSYYFEQNNQLLTNTITSNILQTGTWKSTEANLSVNIKPFVSTDETVTLNISVEKSSFLARAGENAPPGKATQKFESLVRVKNNEMVLLGGLDELQKDGTASGVPLLSRIPIISWFFSSKRKAKSNSKLHIFIRPTIVY
ncbi:type II secretion system protein GspD [Flavobacterium rhizosphaerae]|uniref:Type II and III secretion system protein n=1 Tax=Flavobacterium rhizosphaerae TaxID=3163298 RepID=A0ABW8YWH2_9FLAO